MKKLISIIIPAYNEEDCVDELSDRLKLLFEIEYRYNFEVYIIENGSTDSTWMRLKDIAHKDDRFKILRLSRNFRMDGGLTAGLDYVNGDACVLMTADLQDPPEMISEFLRLWEDGWQNIYGIVTKRHGTNLLRKLNSQLFYWIASKLTDGSLPKNVSDFRLVDKTVYMAVREMRERNRFVRGLFAWAGFKSIGVPMKRPPRFGGVSNAHTLEVIEFAFRGIFANSNKPLRMVTLFGLSLSVFSLSLIIPMSIWWVTKGVPFAGFGTLVCFFLLTLGFMSFMLGIVSEYVGLIYEEVKQRPTFIVSETLNVQMKKL